MKRVAFLMCLASTLFLLAGCNPNPTSSASDSGTSPKVLSTWSITTKPSVSTGGSGYGTLTLYDNSTVGLSIITNNGHGSGSGTGSGSLVGTSLKTTITGTASDPTATPTSSKFTVVLNLTLNANLGTGSYSITMDNWASANGNGSVDLTKK